MAKTALQKLFNEGFVSYDELFAGDWTGLGSLWSGLTGTDLGTQLDSLTGVTANEIEQQNQEYTKDYNQTIWDREDTAMQRKAADMEAAGFSKWAAAGGSGAGAGGTSKPPIRGTIGPQQSQQFAFGAASAIMNVLQGWAQIDKTEAETDLIQQTTPLKVKGLTLDNALKDLNNQYTSNTLNTRINQIKTQYSIDKLRLETSYISTDQLKILQNHLYGETGGGDFATVRHSDGTWFDRTIPRGSPQTIEYDTRAFALLIQEYNKEWAARNGLPVGSNPNMWSSLWSTGSQIDQKIPRDDIKGVAKRVIDWLFKPKKDGGSGGFFK